MIALDTNILVHARRREMEHHAAAAQLLGSLANGDEPWAIPWPCLYEMVRVLTHPRVFRPPTPLPRLLEDLESLLGAPSLILLGEGPRHRGHMLAALSAGDARGNLAFDAHIAALVMEHGVTEFWTLDRDYGRFPGVPARNPFARP